MQDTWFGQGGRYILVRIGRRRHMSNYWYIWFGQGGRYILV